MFPRKKRARLRNKVFEIQKVFQDYSVRDVTTSLFVSSLWLPNSSSLVKHQLLYFSLISMNSELFNAIDKILTYEDFDRFLRKLYSILPDFSRIEDYVPELDWGNVKFYHDGEYYKIFYGGNIECIYDYLYSFQILYSPIDEDFQEEIRRSPIEELKHVLKLQDVIISSIDYEVNKPIDSVSLGYIEVPSDAFWYQASNYYNAFDSIDFLPNEFLENYSVELGNKVSLSILYKYNFSELLINGELASCFFIKYNSRYFSIFPRRFSEIFMLVWKKLYTQYKEKLPSVTRINLDYSFVIANYIKQRHKLKPFLKLVSPVEQDGKSIKTLYACAFIINNRLFLIYVTPILDTLEILQSTLDDLPDILNNSLELLNVKPLTLGVASIQQNVVFEQSDFEIEIITILPITILANSPVTIYKKMPGRIMTLPHFLGLFDEIEDINDLADFFDFLSNQEEKMRSPYVSLLDKYGAYKASHSVIEPGAIQYTHISIYPHWGSNMRYETLNNFWQLFPVFSTALLGDPRSWFVEKEGNNSISLSDRGKLGRILIFKLKRTNIQIYSTLHELDLDDAQRANLMTEIIEDAIIQNRDIFALHDFFEINRTLNISVFPKRLISQGKEYSHLYHLVSRDFLQMDSGILPSRAKGIVIVFDEQLLDKYLLDSIDRSIEVEILLGIMEQLERFIKSAHKDEIIAGIHSYKINTPRFKKTPYIKEISFPDFISPDIPKAKHHNLAQKFVAELALSIGLVPGKYELNQAKDLLNKLRDALVKEINSIVTGYSYQQAIPFLITRIDALVHDEDRQQRNIKASLSHEVDFDRAEYSSKARITMQVNYKSYRYLIEKFVQLTPMGNKELDTEDFQFISAIVLRLHRIYEASDSINYGLYALALEIEDNFIPHVTYSLDVQTMQDTYQREISELELGLVGNISDKVESPRSFREYIDQVSDSFNQGLGFSLYNMLEISKLLAAWSIYNSSVLESTYYLASIAEITKISNHVMPDLKTSEIEKILDFLSLKPEKMLTVIGQNTPTNDLPVWEYNKRPYRYTVRPLIRLADQYAWGSHSILRTMKTWVGAITSLKLPYNMNITEIDSVVLDERKMMEKELERKTYGILKELTTFARSNLELKKYGNHPDILGDYDVFAYFSEQNLFFNIECKHVLPTYSLKDDSGLRDSFFGKIGSDNRGWIGKVERREKYLTDNSLKILEDLQWGAPNLNPPKVVSVLVTIRMNWWIRFPPVHTSVQFTTIELLRDWIKKTLLQT